MFTVKATYRGETRKLSFPECNTFPSFEQICNHLYRVFPVSHNYFLSKLLFSANASQSSRVLIGRQVRTADEYNNCIRPFQYQEWSGGLLRFIILDDNTRGLITNQVEGRLHSTNLDSARSPKNTPLTGSLPLDLRPTYAQVIPPPPIIYSSSSSLSEQEVMDRYFTPRNSYAEKPSPKPCCPIADVKVQVQSLISKFQRDLDYTLSKTFGEPSHPADMSPTQTPKPSSPPEGITSSSVATASPVCSNCALRHCNAWYSCDNCRIILCSKCSASMSTSGFCIASMGLHSMKFGLPSNQFPFSTSSPSQGLPNWVHPSPPVQTAGYPAWSSSYQPCPIVSAPISNLTAPTAQLMQESSMPDVFIPPVSPELSPRLTPAQASYTQVQHPPAPERPSTPLVIHTGVVCDSCDLIIRGIRHKCLDCPNYDLCSACISAGSAESHNPFHEFFEITEPGRVIVHTVFEGSQASPAPAADPQPAPFTDREPANHPATCNLCDSRIQGDRYKCVACPDFDACNACFGITNEQHPDHAFVKFSNPEDFIRRGTTSQPMHLATCNVCSAVIVGTRYKCMHPECPDFDLCANCEAHPISVHPDNHPLLKMKNPDTVIPTVYRVGGTQLIEEPVARDEAIVPEQDAAYISNAFVSEPGSPVVKPPSPFYFGEEEEVKTPLVSQVVLDARPASPGLPSVSVMDGLYADEQSLFNMPPVLPVIDVSGSFSMTPPAAETAAAYNPFDDPLLEWKRSHSDLGHLMEDHAKEAVAPVSDVHSLDGMSVLSGNEALLNPPEMQQRRSSGIPQLINAFSLASLLRGEEAFFTPKSVSMDIEEVEYEAAFVSDVTVPDGQVFPPGAEFVKCWRMANIGKEDWPEGTELVFVGGSALGCDKKVGVKVGSVKAGSEVDVTTCELKAPEAPGRYISYWRLKDGNGRVFGYSIWIEIDVAEVGKYSDDSESSLASSTIIMPHGAQSEQVSSVTVSADGVSEHGSDGSSISLLSGTLSDEEDEQMWEDSRREVAPEPATEYVLLYDDAVSSEEE